VSGLKKSVNRRHLKNCVINPLDEPPSVRLISQDELRSAGLGPFADDTESDDGLVISEDASVSVFADETKEINIFLLTKEDEATAPPDKKAAITKATSFKNLLMTQLPKAIVWYFLHSYLPDDLRMFTLANIGYFEIVFKMNEYENQLQKFITELNEQAATNPLYQNFQDLILQSRKVSKVMTMPKKTIASVERYPQRSSEDLCLERGQADVDLYLTDASRKDKRRKMADPNLSSVPRQDMLYCDEQLPTATLSVPEVIQVPSRSVSNLPLATITHPSVPFSSSAGHKVVMVKSNETDDVLDVMNSVLVSVSQDQPPILLSPPKVKKSKTVCPNQVTRPGFTCVLTKATFQERLCSFRADTHCSMDVGVVIVKGNMRRRVREVKLTEVTLKWLENCFIAGTEIILTKKSLNKNILEQFNNPEKVTSKRSVVSCLDTLRGVALHLIDLELQQEGGDRKKANNKFSHYQRQSRSAGDRLTKEYAEKYAIDAQNYNCSDIEEKMDASLMIFNKGGYLIYCSLVLKKTNCIFYYDGESMFLVKERFVRAFGSRYNINNKPKAKNPKDTVEVVKDAQT